MIKAIQLKTNSNAMLRRYYIGSALRTALFYIPILVIYFQHTINKPIQVGILISLKTISTLIFEIPTGIVADYFSRKASVIIGFFLNILSIVIFIVMKDFMWFALAQVLFGVAETFYSGADTALIYDNLKAVNTEGYYEKVVQNVSLISSIALFISFITGSYFYSMNKIIPFVCSFVAILIALLIFITIPEYPYNYNLF